MKVINKPKKIVEWIGIGLVILSVLTIFFLASGGTAIFANHCTGQRDLPVGEATTFWQLAERHFPNDNPRVVTDRMVEMNHGDYQTLHRSTIKAPAEC